MAHDDVQMVCEHEHSTLDTRHSTNQGMAGGHGAPPLSPHGQRYTCAHRLSAMQYSVINVWHAMEVKGALLGWLKHTFDQVVIIC